MSEAHTPGSWALDGEDINDYGNLVGIFVAKHGNGRVAKTFLNCLVIDDEECRANARLIAAAPDLFEALKAALSVMELDGNDAGMVGKIAREAIAKVTDVSQSA